MYSRFSVNQLKSLIRKLGVRKGYFSLTEEEFYNLKKELEDLRSFRDAAESELNQLKNDSYLKEDEITNQRIYLDTAVRNIENLQQNVHSIEQDPSMAEETLKWKSLANINPPDRTKKYSSCEWIEGGLCFIDSRIRVCPNCIEAGGTPSLMSFFGKDLSIDNILRIRKIIILANQNGGFQLCRGCPHLKTKVWPPRKWLFDRIDISHFTSCNLLCEYCHATPEKKQLQSPSSIIPLKSTFLYLINGSYLSPQSIVQWGGGEPTVPREFDELFELISDYGARSEVCTNAVSLSKSLLKGLENNKQVGLMISIDAGTKETYKAVKGKDNFYAVIKNIRKYVTANKYKVILKMIIYDRNMQDVIPFLDLAEDIGVGIVCYDVLMRQDSINDNIIKAAALFKKEGLKRGFDVRVGKVGFVYKADNDIEKYS